MSSGRPGRKAPKRWGWLALLAAAAWAAACSSTQKRPTAAENTPAPGAARSDKQAEQEEEPAAEAGGGGPERVSIGDLQIDAQRTVRISGVVSRIIGMRLVPPQRILEVRDRTGGVTVLIKSKKTFGEGTQMDLIGVYKKIPSPTHTGPGEAAEEPIFVVERFLDLP